MATWIPPKRSEALANELAAILRDVCGARCMDDVHDRAATVAALVFALTGKHYKIQDLCTDVDCEMCPIEGETDRT